LLTDMEISHQEPFKMEKVILLMKRG